MDIGTNWAGNHAYAARGLVRPGSLDELQETVAAADRIRPLGSRHSFSDLTDTTGLLVDLSGLPTEVTVDEDARTVAVGGGVRYGDLAVELEARGWALANLASLPHISVAGAVATGTHGSGDRNATLSAAVGALEVVGPDGALRRTERGDTDFDGSVVALGALGIVSRLELDIEPSYAVAQSVHTGLRWDTVEERFDDISRSGYSVSLFTRFDPDEVDQLWVKQRVEDPAPGDLFGSVPAATAMHMLQGGDTEALTSQGSAPGRWLDRLPHFRMEFTPSRGEELQSEYFLPRDRAVAGLAALRRLAPGFGHLLQVVEVRTITADDLWLSGAQGRETVAFHFTWDRDEPAVRAALRPVEEALLPLGARPHWGKVFELDAAALAAGFPRLAEFVALRDRVDPDRVFGNAFLERALG